MPNYRILLWRSQIELSRGVVRHGHMSGSFLWHDYETFGTNPRVDRASEFACWRTNADFEPIEDPHSFRCQPNLDYLPDATSCLITGIGPEAAYAGGVPEPEFAARVHAQLSEPGTCGIGYNSLRFDDELTRHLLWRNFFDPYEREWARGCSRFDLIDLARAAYALRPEGVQWPMHDERRPSFKLTDLTAANQISHRHAHAALSDVEASISLGQILRRAQPKLLDYALNLRNKGTVLRALDWQSRKPMIHVSQRFPADRGCLALVVPLAPHPSQSGKIIAVDAYHDPLPLLTWSAERLAEAVVAPSGESRVPTGLKVIHANRFPFIAPVSVLQGADLARISFDRDRTLANARRLIDADGLDQKIQQVYSLLEQGSRADQDPEAALYSGFVSDADRALCVRFRRAVPEDLAALTPGFADPRLRTLAQRYRARHFPELLNKPERVRWTSHCQERLANGERNLSGLRTRITDFPAEQSALAQDISAWCERVAKNANLPPNGEAAT